MAFVLVLFVELRLVTVPLAIVALVDTRFVLDAFVENRLVVEAFIANRFTKVDVAVEVEMIFPAKN